MSFALTSLSSSCSLIYGELKGDVTRDDSQRRFLAQHSVAMLEQCCNHSKQSCKNVATLRCAKNRCCKLSRVLNITLTKDDDNGSENRTSRLKKMNLRPFKLYRDCLDPLDLSNVGDFSWSEIIKDFIFDVKKIKPFSSFRQNIKYCMIDGYNSVINS